MNTMTFMFSNFYVNAFYAFLFGLIWGSFFNVCIYRIPREQSLAKKGSHCVHCKKPIPFYYNIPLLGYLIVQGKCFNCKKAVSIQYPLVELATGIMFVLLFWHYGLTWRFAAYTVFCSALLVITVIDLHHRIIPDVISLPGIVIGFLACFVTKDVTWQQSLIGILLGGGSLLLVALLYEKLARKEGMGGGDVKLLAMIGAWLGYNSILMTIVVSSFAGSFIGIFLKVFLGPKFDGAIPFGPFLALGAVIYLIWGHQLQDLLILTP